MVCGLFVLHNKALEGDDYDPIWLLFNGTFNDDEEDDDGEP